MKKMLLLALCGSALCMTQTHAQEKCLTNFLLQKSIAAHPELAAAREHYKAHSQQQAELFAKQKTLYKTTAPVSIPVVFHVVLSSSRQVLVGGASGILQRAIDQINVLNEDFNGTNSDRNKTPTPFVPFLGSPDISFGFAHRKPDGTSTNGVEITTTSVSTFSALINNGSLPKSSATNGADPWDPNKYLNIWIVDIAESGVLGYTIPPSFIGMGYSLQDIGVVIDFGAFGKRGGAIQFFSPSVNDRGRTATHEVGHFFELEHTFGDGSGCPPATSDDGIADTPPQDDPIYGAPLFPQTDACTPIAPGVMFMNFVDYTDDSAMYMFTKGQAIYMQTKLTTGILHSLTLHPELFDWPTATTDIEKEKRIEIYPNPASGKFTVSLNQANDLQRISVVNMMGQNVYSIVPADSIINNYDVDLTGMSKGVYMVQCTFARGTITKKIILQ